MSSIMRNYQVKTGESDSFQEMRSKVTQSFNAHEPLLVKGSHEGVRLSYLLEVNRFSISRELGQLAMLFGGVALDLRPESDNNTTAFIAELTSDDEQCSYINLQILED